MMQGTFQKTGGTIDYNTNTGTYGVRRNNVAIHFGMSNTTLDSDMNDVHWWMDDNVGEDVLLFTNGVRQGSPNNSSAGTLTKSVWVPDNWDK